MATSDDAFVQAMIESQTNQAVEATKARKLVGKVVSDSLNQPQTEFSEFRDEVRRELATIKGCNRAIPDETRGNQGDCLAKRC